MKHLNNGRCEKCQEIMNKYPGINALLKAWFEDVQEKNPDFHCSDAGRGYLDQELYFQRKSSLAHFGESAHNYNAAIDTFFLIDGKYCVDLDQYVKHIEPEIPDWLQWGHNWEHFSETPHFEIKAWRTLREFGGVKLVEDHKDANVG